MRLPNRDKPGFRRVTGTRIDGLPDGDEERVARCIAAICNMSRQASRMDQLDGRGAIELLGKLWAGWQAHWAFEDHYGETRFRLLKHGYSFDITNPQAVGVYEHEIGLRGRGDPYGHESYVFTSLSELCAPRTVEKYERMLGAFAEIIPMWPDCPYNPYRVTVWSRSPHGAGNAMECRMELKRILGEICPQLRKYASIIRHFKRRPKHTYLVHYIGMPPKNAGKQELQRRREMRRKPTLQPKEYRMLKKGQLWLKWRCPDYDRALMAQVVVSGDPYDFWRIAAGEVRSLDVADMMVHQLALDLEG